MTHLERLLRDTRSAPWKRIGEGVKVQELGADSRSETRLVRLAAGASVGGDGRDREVLVLEGRLRAGELDLGQGDFGRWPGRADVDLVGDGECTLYLRSQTPDPGDDTGDDTGAVCMRLTEQPWLPGQGNLRVKPISGGATGGSALVHWPAGERFQPHRHWGGEEVLVLSGTFIDEQGRYPAGTWLQSPHLSAHHPFVEQETVIFVRTGHLHPGLLDPSSAAKT